MPGSRFAMLLSCRNSVCGRRKRGRVGIYPAEGVCFFPRVPHLATWGAHTPRFSLSQVPLARSWWSHVVPTCVPGGSPGGMTRSRRAPHSTVVL